jgi:hypothetical protein
VDLIASLDPVVKRKISCPYQEWDSGRPAQSPSLYRLSCIFVIHFSAQHLVRIGMLIIYVLRLHYDMLSFSTVRAETQSSFF